MIKKSVKLSAEFKSQILRTVGTLILFAFVYLLIVTLAIGLTVLCAYGGIMLIVTVPKLIAIGLGIGLAGLGFLILFFVLKFIFSSNKSDRSHLHEITRSDEPELFDMLDEIVSKVGTTFPKKVYLSADVNASVFYDSSFWSMFMPIRKNLQIGLGLVNMVTHDELKAILAHEFGHFSQRSMKVGSYVYNVNQIIYNMLNDDQSFQKMISGWANTSGYFAIFVIIAVKIIEAIQWILRKMYAFVNTSYMALSRQMEFHADEIAANITGFEPLKNALLRMNLADHSFNSVLGFYNDKFSENLKSNNIYLEQAFVMRFYATIDGIRFSDTFPMLTTEELNKSKLVIDNQWASHPSTEERIANLERTGLINRTYNNSPANAIFRSVESNQEKLTAFMFKDVAFKGESRFYSIDDFKISFESEFLKNSFSSKFNNYYNDKNPLLFETSGLEPVEKHELFSDEMKDLVYIHIALESDIARLEQISDERYGIKTFDYDGVRYKRKDAIALKDKLTQEAKAIKEQILQNDIRIFQHFKARELAIGKCELQNHYEAFFDFEKQYDKSIEKYSAFSDSLEFINFTNDFQTIINNFRNIEPIELQIKNLIRTLINDPKLQGEITEEMRESFFTYLSKDLIYFEHTIYMDDNLKILFTALNNYVYLLSRTFFLYKLDLLNYQTSLLD